MMRGGLVPLIPRNRQVSNAEPMADTGQAGSFDDPGQRYYQAI